ncbi:hypothetical protein Dda_5654 [Drechslerella dactyloides]|uniref:Uncharacterized protein n=1 Tax=Drechslerella dactyloides TaxID=74499 RepID=A0AAD6IWK7_DREDA|nr:hypothetical protein Dda_5654 [Drechslerella dactyloides]
MPIKPYFPTSPPLRATHVGAVSSCPRRISALIIEEDLSDIDTSDSSWFLPATTYETVTISQRGPLPAPAVVQPEIASLDLPTAADTSRRPSICLARLQTKFQDDGDINIHLPNYDCAVHSPCSFKPSSPGFKRAEPKSHSRRGSNSEVFFHSPLRRFRTYSRSNSSTASTGSVSSTGSSSAASGYESPVFYPDECSCDDFTADKHQQKECEISKTASSMPIRVPGSAKRRRRGCFVQDDVSSNADDEAMDDDGSSLEDWVQFAYTPNSTFETALISEVVRRRRSDERFANLKNHGTGFERELESAQFTESHRRSEWMRDMVRCYPQECGGGHVLPCF